MRRRDRTTEIKPSRCKTAAMRTTKNSGQECDLPGLKARTFYFSIRAPRWQFKVHTDRHMWATNKIGADAGFWQYSESWRSPTFELLANWYWRRKDANSGTVAPSCVSHSFRISVMAHSRYTSPPKVTAVHRSHNNNASQSTHISKNTKTNSEYVIYGHDRERPNVSKQNLHQNTHELTEYKPHAVDEIHQVWITLAPHSLRYLTAKTPGIFALCINIHGMMRQRNTYTSHTELCPTRTIEGKTQLHKKRICITRHDEQHMPFRRRQYRWEIHVTTRPFWNDDGHDQSRVTNSPQHTQRITLIIKREGWWEEQQKKHHRRVRRAANIKTALSQSTELVAYRNSCMKRFETSSEQPQVVGRAIYNDHIQELRQQFATDLTLGNITGASRQVFFDRIFRTLNINLLTGTHVFSKTKTVHAGDVSRRKRNYRPAWARQKTITRQHATTG